MTRTVWELLVARAHAKRLGPGSYSHTKRTPHFLPWSQTIRGKMWTWASYHAKRTG